MKVLLCEDVENLGFLGDVVEVKDGFARNYLLPQALGTEPSEANIKALAEAKAKRAEERKLARRQLERAAEAVEGAEAVLAAKANELGHLFGSITKRDIAANLREQGFEIADDMVQLSEHIKVVGTHQVPLKIAPDLTASVNVTVVSQDETVESAGQEKEG
ncbi:MAG TPA: 50S ribosomal protein L9 [Planctomycetes bacterium]|nr:50S ribosomal protein L9 [Planctomycetota bacterium]HIJ71244.1 50S ribosomal protein L9 [Planctomycetota bacterium]